MDTKSAPSLEIIAAGNGLIVRPSHNEAMRGMVVENRETMVFNIAEDLFDYLTEHFIDLAD